MKTIRGTVHWDCTLGNWPVVPTWHPAYVLRAFTNRTTLESDIRKALEVAAGTYHDTTITTEVLKNLIDIDLYFDGIKPGQLTAVDIETKHGDIDCIGFCMNGMHGVTIPLADGKRRVFSPIDEAMVFSAIANFLSDPTKPKVFQNGQFDVWWIWYKWRMAVHGWEHDTRIIHHAMWPDQQKDLGTMAATHLDVPAWKSVVGEGEK